MNIGRAPHVTKPRKKTKMTDDVGEKIHKILDETPALHVENCEVSIRVPDKLCTFDVAAAINRQITSFEKIPFPISEIKRMTVHSLGSSKFVRLDNAISQISNGFQLSIKKIPEDLESILLTIEYEIPDMSFIENIVQTEVAAEPSKDEDSYWMHAQLKNLRWFKERYDRWQLLNTPFHVDVAIENEVATAIPPYFVRHLRLLRQVIREPDPHRLSTVTRLLAISRRKIRGDPYSLIETLGGLFEPSQFIRFIEVISPFEYAHLKKGHEYLDFPTGVFPKTMSVTCLTRLDLETPASDGKLVYRKRDLYEEISEIFES